MEIKEVNQIPRNYRQLNKNNQQLVQKLQELQTNKTIEITPENGRKAQNMVTGLKNAARRINKTFKFRVRNNKIYIENITQEE